ESGRGYLIESHTPSLLPSASWAVALRSRSRDAQGPAVFFADPDSDDPRLRLPASRREVDAGHRALRAGPPPFLGRDATKRSFLATGVPTVISTLWPIEDNSAAELFRAFYARAPWVGMAQALAEAQRHLLSSPDHASPYFWAAYNLTGDWSNRLGPMPSRAKS